MTFHLSSVYVTIFESVPLTGKRGTFAADYFA